MEKVRRGYSSTRTGRKTKDYGENLEYPYNERRYWKENVWTYSKVSGGTAISRFRQTNSPKMLNYDNIVTKNDNIHLESE